MTQKFRFAFPSRRDWLWVLGLIAIGGLLGFGLNAVSPNGINLKIALEPDDPAPSPAAADAGGISPTAEARP
jgi:hypothetical protein